MSNITDAKLVIETVLGHSMTNDALIRVADAYWAADPHSLIHNGVVVPADLDNPTNEEKSELFLKTLKKSGQEVVKHVAAKAADDAAAAAKAAAEAAAADDMT